MAKESMRLGDGRLANRKATGPKSQQLRTPKHEAVWNDSTWQSGIRRSLTRWFDTNQRQLPWRMTREPYLIWVSEIMLQQTQVATVIDYFNRFTSRFPTVTDLANAELDEVLMLWEGLGYYRRARQLHAAAQKIVAKHNGVFPTEFADVLDLPGIGRYTAGAILSISRDQRLPVVEANTVRLYSRLIALQDAPAESASTRLLWSVAEAVIPDKQCGKFNQAAMELGALVCTPRNPDCDLCPLEKFCQARRLGLQTTIPGRVKNMIYEARQHVALVVSRGDSFFLRVCQPGSHWEGLWDFPRYDVTNIDEDQVGHVTKQFATEFGWSVDAGEQLAKMRHGVTKYRIELRAFRAHLVNSHVVRETNPASETSSAKGPLQGWFSVSQLEDLPLNTTGRKLAKLLALQ